MLAYHVDPVLYEGYITDARDYLKLAIRTNGPLPANRTVDYVWGDTKAVRYQCFRFLTTYSFIIMPFSDICRYAS